MIGTITDAWVNLASAGIAGFAAALVLAAFALLAIGNAIIWPIAWATKLARSRGVAERPQG